MLSTMRNLPATPESEPWWKKRDILQPVKEFDARYMSKHPLAEVFGFPINNHSAEAVRQREKRLCPFNNKVPNCTKDKANNPLGVCSVFEGDSVAITCPIRFREDWLIAEHAAEFFFPPEAKWTSLVEVRLNDKHGNSAGNIDIVLVAYDEKGKVIDFGSCEVQAVYISGNIREPFEHYMESPATNSKMDWVGQPNYPRPDYLSSSRKRLAPQLLFKGGIFKAWGKKQAVAIHRGFYETLPKMAEVDEAKAEIAWMVYDLKHDNGKNVYQLTRSQIVYTSFQAALQQLTTSEAGPVEKFVERLQSKLNEKLESPPDAPSLADNIVTE
ncbi:MAG TPA: NotI family restriction endonuclease [Terriglobia bacterium]|nr:NotI family restriction endonuclease [Terriglobia bacterium]